MAISLSKFERAITEPVILQQGRKLFRLGLVTQCTDENGEVEAVVQDTEQNRVSMVIDDEGLIHTHRCSCSYDWSEFCQHEVAVLYYLRDQRKQAIHKQQVTDIIAQMKAPKS